MSHTNKKTINNDVYENQINKLKEDGITFNNISIEDSITHLKDKTYLFRLKCYLNNYEKKDERYNLDFSELIEISTLDFHLRKLILSITIDIEHIIRVRLMNLYDNNQINNVNEQINGFIKNGNIDILKMEDINHLDYKYYLYKKYENKWELWALAEILSFGSLIKLIQLLKVKIRPFNNYYFPIKKLRNAVAHNSLLLCNLKNTNNTFHFTKKLKDWLLKNNFTKKDISMLCIPILNDFMCLLLVVYKFSDNKVISHRIVELVAFFERVKKKKIITSKRLIDIFKLLDKFHNIIIEKNKKK